MLSRHKSATLAALVALLLCVGAAAFAAPAPQAFQAPGPGISSAFLAPVPGSGQLLRSGHSQSSRLLAGTPYYVIPRPVLVPRPSQTSQRAGAFCPTRSSVLAGVHAGRSPPCFS
jgi:hypothetical protein